MENHSDTSALDTTHAFPGIVGWDAAGIGSGMPAAFDHEDASGIVIHGRWQVWHPCPGSTGPGARVRCVVRSGIVEGDGHSGLLDTATLIVRVNPPAQAASIVASRYPEVTGMRLRDVLDTVFERYFSAQAGRFARLLALADRDECRRLAASSVSVPSLSHR